MSSNHACNSSFWNKEEDKIFENTIAIYFNDEDLLTKMAEALPGKSRDDILNHYNILVEDVTTIESGCVPLPDEQQGDSSQNSNADGGWRRGASWYEAERRSFLEGLAKYGRGDWRSISRYCVITRTPMQVASHAQKYFKRLKAVPKGNRRRRSILDITSADVEVAGTSQAVPSTNNESLLPQQMTAFAGGESSGNNAAFANSMNCLYPDVNDEFMEQEVAIESGFLADAGSSISEQPFTVTSSETSSHPITRIGSELEALITEHKDEDNDINSIFDVGKATTSHAMLYNAAHGGSSSSTVASSGSFRSRHTHQGSK